MQHPNYDSAAENTLRKVMAQRFINALPSALERYQPALQKANVAGMILKGSTGFAFLDEEPLLTRGQRDADLMLCSIEGKRAGLGGKKALTRAMDEAAEKTGLELVPYRLRDMSLHEILVTATRRKIYFLLNTDDTKSFAGAALEDPTLRLTPRDREVLRDIHTGNIAAPSLMDVNVHLNTGGVDIAPVGRDKSPLSRERFFGLGAAHPLADIAGQVQFINFYDDKYTVYVDLANATAALNDGKGLTREDVSTIKREIHGDPNSLYREYLPFRKISQIKDGIMKGQPWRTIYHGISMVFDEAGMLFLHQPPTAERAELLAKELNKRRDANLIDREAPFTVEECRALWQHTHDLSRILLNKEYDLIPATGFGGEATIRAMLNMPPPDDTTLKPETPGHVKEILSRPPISPESAKEMREKGDGKEGQTLT